MKATWGGRGIPTHNLDVRRGWMANVTPRSLYPQESDVVPISQKVRWDSGAVWTGTEYLPPPFPTGVRTPDRLACSKWLC
jgi:hypothetical protein